MEVFYQGIIGVTTALEQAHRALLEGTYDQCIIGSIDSLLLQSRIGQLLVNDEIKTADQQDHEYDGDEIELPETPVRSTNANGITGFDLYWQVNKRKAHWNAPGQYSCNA